MFEYDSLIKELTKAGWHKGRKIDISENLIFLESRGFEVFESAKEFMQEYGELKIEIEDKGTRHLLKHSTCIRDVIGIGDSSWFGLEEYINEKVIPVGDFFDGDIILYISESGKFYEQMGWAGNEPLEALDNVINEHGIIIWDKYLK